MALMRISKYRATFEPGSRPDRRTIIKRIEAKEVVGEKQGGIWYIDLGRWMAPTPNAPHKPRSEAESA